MQLTPSTDQGAKLHVSKILAGPFVYSPQLLLYSGPLCSVVFLSKSQHALIHRLFRMCFMQDSSSELVAINHLFSVAKSKQRATIQ